jgi:hypothetical protein
MDSEDYRFNLVQDAVGDEDPEDLALLELDQDRETLRDPEPRDKKSLNGHRLGTTRQA